MKDLLKNVSGFNWDGGNSDKNLIKHNVHTFECEEVFFNKPMLLFFDKKHSRSENRYYVLGITTFGRKLMIVFTIRTNKIRVISARNMSRNERKIYEKA